MALTNQITALISADPDLSIIDPFVEQSETKSLKGSIRVSQSGLPEPLIFDLIFYPNYPLSKASFTPRDILWYKHQLIDGEICLPEIKNEKAVEKLKEEIAALKQWVAKYYVKDTIDDHYEYLLISRSANQTILFSDTKKAYAPNENGYFRYSDLLKKNGNEICLIQDFKSSDKKLTCSPEVEYSSPVRALDKSWGIWIYLDHEPVEKRRKVVCTWEALSQHLTFDNLEFILNFHNSKLSEKLDIKLLIGYPIVEKGVSETHWELLVIDRSGFPLKRKNEITEVKRESLRSKLNYGCSKNISYHRYFGRGALSKQLSDSKILILGIGAIGSNLAELLARGGARYLDVADKDWVEPGNICRASYFFSEIDEKKTTAIHKHLAAISPYIDVKVTSFVIKTIKKQHDQFEMIRKQLDTYNWIFNCTTDMELTYMLDQMNLEARVFDLSISNEAKDFVAVTGKSIVKRKELFFRDLDASPATFYEGAGCFSPTFKASYFDINTLLNYAIKHINHRLEAQYPLTSFIIRTQETDIGTIELKLYAD